MMKRNDRIDRMDQVEFARGVVRESRLKVSQLERQVSNTAIRNFAAGLVVGMVVGLGVMAIGMIL